MGSSVGSEEVRSVLESMSRDETKTMMKAVLAFIVSSVSGQVTPAIITV